MFGLGTISRLWLPAACSSCRLYALPECDACLRKLRDYPGLPNVCEAMSRFSIDRTMKRLQLNRGCHWFHTYMQNRHMWADIMNGKLPLMPGAFPQAAPSSAEVDVLATPSHREASIQSSRNRQRT